MAVRRHDKKNNVTVQRNTINLQLKEYQISVEGEIVKLSAKI